MRVTKPLVSKEQTVSYFGKDDSELLQEKCIWRALVTQDPDGYFYFCQVCPLYYHCPSCFTKNVNNSSSLLKLHLSCKDNDEQDMFINLLRRNAGVELTPKSITNHIHHIKTKVVEEKTKSSKNTLTAMWMRVLHRLLFLVMTNFYWESLRSLRMKAKDSSTSMTLPHLS